MKVTVERKPPRLRCRLAIFTALLILACFSGFAHAADTGIRYSYTGGRSLLDLDYTSANMEFVLSEGSVTNGVLQGMGSRITFTGRMTTGNWQSASKWNASGRIEGTWYGSDYEVPLSIAQTGNFTRKNWQPVFGGTILLTITGSGSVNVKISKGRSGYIFSNPPGMASVQLPLPDSTSPVQGDTLQLNPPPRPPPELEDSGVRFSSISKEVEIFHEGNPDDRNYVTWKTVIYDGDHIITGEDSSVIVGFPDFSTLVIGPNSEIIIAGRPKDLGKWELVKGKFWMNVKKVLNGEPLEVKSNLATIGIKGTAFTVDAAPSATTVKVIEGLVAVTPRAVGIAVSISGGQSVVATAEGLGPVMPFDVNAEIAAWRSFMNTATASGGAAADEKEAILRVLYRNTEALQNRDLKAYMETIDPTCSSYQNTETQSRRLCQQYSLKIELYDVKVREIRGNEAKVEFCQKTVKLAGPEFHNNIITGVHTFRKVAGSWKLSSTKINITRYLLLE
ncbi:MAG: FecR domain-containing protein [Candidatus Xenobiia bacterium LiM19]